MLYVDFFLKVISNLLGKSPFLKKKLSIGTYWNLKKPQYKYLYSQRAGKNNILSHIHYFQITEGIMHTEGLTHKQLQHEFEVSPDDILKYGYGSTQAVN